MFEDNGQQIINEVYLEIEVQFSVIVHGSITPQHPLTHIAVGHAGHLSGEHRTQSVSVSGTEHSETLVQSHEITFERQLLDSRRKTRRVNGLICIAVVFYTNCDDCVAFIFF
jgi:hypothetical protein